MTKLVAALVCKNEVTRFLPLVIEHLLSFTDEVVVLDDGSDDGTTEFLVDRADQRLIVRTQNRSTFYEHEGRLRGELLRLVLERSADAVLSVDCDEVLSDGPALRAHLEAEPDVQVWSLEMAEAWNADADGLSVRIDGGWRPHELPLLWRVPRDPQTLRMLDRKLACRRVPMQVLSQKAKPSGITCFHLGWLDKATRQARYDRYAKHDGGKFHASSHLRSILYPDSRVTLQRRPWPEGSVFDQLRERFAAVTA